MVKYFLKMTSSISMLNFPRQVDGATKLKVSSLRYVSQSSDDDIMLIKIQNFQDKNWYYDGNQMNSYTVAVGMIHKIDSLILYDNHSPYWDVINPDPTNINTVMVEILIKNPGDISVLNPLFIELTIE